MNKGWIKLHRTIQECWIWLDDKPYSKGQAWVDILLSCNHADKKIAFDGKPEIIKRGEWLTSVVSLAERWGWGRKKVSNFLNILESDSMIEQKRNNKRTLIKVVNYDVYQVMAESEGTSEEHQGNTEGTSEEHQRNTNNNVKNDKNENNVNKNNIYSSNFEEFWKVYPRKVDKAKANKCYQARVKEGWSEEELLKAAKAYAESCKKNGTEDKYIKHGATFLSAGTPFVDYLKGSEKNESVGTDESHYDERQKRILASKGMFVS